MFKTARMLALTGLTGMMALGIALGADQQKGPNQQKGKDIESKETKQVPATTVDFAKDLDLGFSSLKTLGSRIEQARADADPVGLATAAMELQAAEKVSGKQAPITSAELTRETIEMARQQDRPRELRAVAMILRDGSTKELEDLAAKADKDVAARKEAKDKGEQSRGIPGSLHIDNRTSQWLRVYVNGNYVGQVSPYGDGVMSVGQNPNETTFLAARGSSGGTWNYSVNEPVADFTWRLWP